MNDIPSDATVIVRSDQDDLATAVANALDEVVTATVAQQGQAHIVLTGGSMGTALMRALAANTTGTVPCSLTWSQVDVWWGDERFVPSGDKDRNDTQALEAGLAALGLRRSAIHQAPTPADTGGDLPTAARRYADDLRAAAEPGSDLPRIDVLMLGVGPDGHVASLFPTHPGLEDSSDLVIAVEDSPKPPPRRVSFSLAALHHAERVWFLVSGADKADVVAQAWSPGCTLPVARVNGRQETVWWLDEAAASRSAEGRRQ